MDALMDTRRLRVLQELAERGTMRQVAAATGYSTSAVSAQLAALEDEVGVRLLEPDGRLVRFTPAGRRLLAHSTTILSDVESALADLNPDALPHGLVRVASYASALVANCVPVTRDLLRSHPDVQVELQEREPDEVLELLRDDAIDIGISYDYSLAPRPKPRGYVITEVASSPLNLALPTRTIADFPHAVDDDLALLVRDPWIVNSRGADDDELAARVCAFFGVTPTVTHRADSLEIVQAFVAAGLGIALFPAAIEPQPGVRMVPLPATMGSRRSFVAIRQGREHWPATALFAQLIGANIAAHAAT